MREPVASRSKPTARPSWSAVSVQTRSPTATAPSPVNALREPLEDRGAVVGLVDDDHLARGLLAQVERGEHAREEEDGVAPGAEERAGDPAVSVRRLAEVRDLPLDAGQVLQVGRRREEERVDALLLEPLGEALLARGVVEHGRDVS